jgi:hypothetical protein
MTQAFSVDILPTQEDADADNKVNWFHPKCGWIQGDWRFPLYTDCTHWAKLPERPAAVDPEVAIATSFKVWISSLPTEFDASTVALLKTGFRGGWRQAKAHKP